MKFFTWPRFPLFAVGLALALGATPEAHAQTPPSDPSSASSDQKQVLHGLDGLIWETFVNTVAPADWPAVKPAIFETWATNADVFGVRARWPDRATANTKDGPVKKFEPSSLRAVVNGTFGHASTARSGAATDVECEKPGAPLGTGKFPPPPACVAEEVRHNPISYADLVRYGLTTKAGIKKAYADGTIVEFSNDAVEVKTDWVPIRDIANWIPGMTTPALIETNYYTSQGSYGNGPLVEYALVGFHINIKTKDNPNWVWATFEHQLNLGRCDTMGCTDPVNSLAVPPNPQPNTTYPPCLKNNAFLRAYMASKHLPAQWNNYCLKAIQTNFVDSKNNPTLDGNSVSERILANVPIEQASCITCHKYASYLADGSPNFKGLKNNNIGAIDNSLLDGSHTADFVWSILKAK